MTMVDVREMALRDSTRRDTLYSWLRYVVGLSSGALTVLVSLGKGIPSDTGNIAQKAALLLLATGLLFGVLRLRGEVYTAQKEADRVEEWLRAKGRGEIPIEAILGMQSIPPMPFAKLLERGCYACLSLALVALVVMAWNLPVSKP